jgi:RNA-dependent RNA polymerase
VPDISNSTTTFSDGVGALSSDLAREIWKSIPSNRKRRVKDTPSAFQFRLGGLKGVVVVNSDLKGRQLQFRESQDKFDAPDLLDFEVCKAFSKYATCYLNRPLIKILEDLGVPPSAFLRLQYQIFLNI